MRHLLAQTVVAAALGVAVAATPLAADIAIEIHQPERVFPGTTAFIDNTGRSRIVEIDAAGKTVWAFELPAEIQPRQRFANDLEWLPETDRFLFMSAPHGIFEVDRNGRIVWSYRTDKASHDADRLQNGNTLFVFGRDGESDAQVTEVAPDGRVVWQWKAQAALAGAQRFELPAARQAAEGYSYTHANAVTRLPNGNTLVSLRNFHMVVEVNPAGEIVWRLPQQPRVHEPQPLENGNFLLSLLVRPDYHPVREVTREGIVVWEFAQPDVLAPTTVQRLPNGNTLIAGQNKIIEVTPQKEVVWKAVLRDVRPVPADMQRHIYKAVRIPQRAAAPGGR